MKFMNVCRKYGVKAAVSGALMTAAAFASANSGIETIGSTAVQEINKLIPIISSIGLALLSLYVTMKAFGLVSSFLSRGK